MCDSLDQVLTLQNNHSQDNRLDRVIAERDKLRLQNADLMEQVVRLNKELLDANKRVQALMAENE